MKTIKLRKMQFGLLAFGSALVLSLAAFTATANAATCSQNWVCFYVHSNYGGSSYAQYNPGHRVCNGVPPAYNDTFSSVLNSTYGYLFMYRDAGCVGIAYQVPPRHGQPSFHWSWNDTVSSYEVIY